MWWVILMLVSGQSLDRVGDDAPAAADAAQDADAAASASDVGVEFGAPDGAALLKALSEPLRREVRCAMLAEAVRYDVNRGAPTKDYGISDALAHALSGRVAAAIKAESGVDDATVRAITKQDFEDYSFDLLGTGKPQAEIDKQFQDALTACKPLFDSVS